MSKEEIGYAFVVAAQLPDQRTTISFQGNLALGSTAAEIGAEMDKLTDVLERQAARADVAPLERQIEAKKKQLDIQKDQIKSFAATLADAENDRSRKVSNLPQVKVNYETALATYEQMQKEIERAEVALLDLKKKAA